jgi:hypothetical protein
MKSSITVKRKKRGRPPTGVRPLVNFRASNKMIEEVDHWAVAQNDKPGRSEALRRLVELGLSVSSSRRPQSQKSRAQAADMAHDAIDRHSDPAATPEERASRKRRLLKGPKEFRDMRRDHPASKGK